MGGELKRGLWTAANAVLLLAFLFSAAVQYNDPDPLRWMAVYGAAAAVCVAELLRRTRLAYPLAVAIVALGWAATIAPRVIGAVRFTDMFAEFEMKNAGVEESREMYGLLIVAAWMGLVALATGLRSARRRV
jgi:hypothetical protein